MGVFGNVETNAKLFATTEIGVSGVFGALTTFWEGL